MSQKIVVEQKLKVPANASHKEHKQRFKRKPLLIFSFVFVIALMIALAAFVYVVVIPAQHILASAHTISQSLGTLASGFQTKDLTQLEGTILTVQTELDKINLELARFDFLDKYNITKGYYRNLQIVSELSTKTGNLLNEAYPELKTTLKEMGYRVELSDPLPSADAVVTEDEQLSELIKELPKIVGIYEKYETDIIDLADTFNKLDPNYVPTVGLGKYRDMLIKAQTITTDFPTTSAKLREALHVFPTLLGAEKPARYLIVFQNEKELRASGGILSSFGNLTIDKGEFVGDIKTIDMWDLNDFLANTGGYPRGMVNIYGQLTLMLRGCGGTSMRPQDAGLYPDLSITLDTFLQYYNLANKRNATRYPSYDHVIIMNTFFASDLVSFIDPITDPKTGRTITAENLPKEIFAETSSQDFDPSIRKEFIGTIATIAQEKFKELPSEQLMQVIIKMFDTVIARNIAFYSVNPDIQNYFNEFNMTGRFEKQFNGDYFHLNEAQNCALKANFYVQDSVTQDVYIEDNGNIRKDIKVSWKNEKVYDPAEPYILSNSERFLYRSWVRVMAPQGTVFTSTDGFRKSGIIRYTPVTYFDSKMQKQVSDNIIRFDHRRQKESDPVRTHDLNVSYRLPDTLNFFKTDNAYRLLLQKHPGKSNEQYKINVHYQGNVTTVEFGLDRDKVVTFKNGIISTENFTHRLDDYTSLIERFAEISE